MAGTFQSSLTALEIEDSLVQAKQTLIDNTGVGTIDQIIKYDSTAALTSNANGDITSITFDSGRKEILTYDVNNTITKIEYFDVDGTTLKLAIDYGLVNGFVVPTLRTDY